MKKPENWYSFAHVDCELFDIGYSNMRPQSQQLYCSRNDRQGKKRPRWEGDKYFASLKCHWDVCPKLKEQRKAWNRRRNE